MSRYYVLDADHDTELYDGPFSSIAGAKACIQRRLRDAYQSNDKPFCECITEEGDTLWSTGHWIIVEEVLRLKATPKVKFKIELTNS